jgi:hypothetical protein
MLSAAATNLPCGQKSVPTPSKPIRAGCLSLRADKNRFVRPFFPPCDENSICAGTLAFRASQLPVRAGKNPSVRPFFDLCRQNPRFLTVLANGDGQKGTGALLRRMRKGREGRREHVGVTLFGTLEGRRAVPPRHRDEGDSISFHFVAGLFFSSF